MTLAIYGAGMAGLLAGTMLRQHRPVLHEAQSALPDNHGALLRFRSDAVARATGQPFRAVRVIKAVKRDGWLHTGASLWDANMYSYKVTGAVEPRSVLDLAACERYVAPDRFLSDMADYVTIEYGDALDRATLEENASRRTPIISTIPMPVLMRIVEWPSAPTFAHRLVTSLSIDLDETRVNIYQTIYYPEERYGYYRASITGHRLIIEFPGYFPVGARPEDVIYDVLDDFGINRSFCHLATSAIKTQPYGKILPIPDRERQEFILAMTDQYNLYSVGRFATWRQILLDDVVRDVALVDRMITERSAYRRRLHAT